MCNRNSENERKKNEIERLDKYQIGIDIHTYTHT
jgi:hypothetical protein